MSYYEVNLNNRLKLASKNSIETENYFIDKFNNCRFIDSNKSKNGCFSKAQKYIFDAINTR